MGWKRLKETFGIEHYVQVTERGICIGSGYVHNLAVIDPKTGKIYENPTFRNFIAETYPALQAASPAELLRLIEAPDEFAATIPVFTFNGGDIIEKRCEVLGWPNVTHDGVMMYDNSYAHDKDKVVAWAKGSATHAIEQCHERIQDVEAELAKLRSRLAALEANRDKLNANYPEIKGAT